jgi:hypothetical protein
LGERVEATDDELREGGRQPVAHVAPRCIEEAERGRWLGEQQGPPERHSCARCDQSRIRTPRPPIDTSPRQPLCHGTRAQARCSAEP